VALLGGCSILVIEIYGDIDDRLIFWDGLGLIGDGVLLATDTIVGASVLDLETKLIL